MNVQRLTESSASALRIPPSKVALSTASVYPATTDDAFEMASRLGYDGVEVMIWTDPISQDVDALARLSDEHELPVLAIHSPCLLITQRVWSPDPWIRLTRSIDAAQRLGAPTVVVHPPFRWQRDYARKFVKRVAELEEDTGITIAVENMYPWRAAGRELAAYLPDWDPTDEDYAHCTLDLSHTAVSGSDAVAMAAGLGDRLAHLHLADGNGSPRDEHLVPGRGSQPCAPVLEGLAQQNWGGTVVVEISTRKAKSSREREADLAESLAFARLNLATALDSAYAVAPDGTVEAVRRRAGRG